MFETEEMPKNEFRVQMPECANGCGRDCESEEILQTAKGRVCTYCFDLMELSAKLNRESFGYKFKKFLKRYLGL